MNLVTLLNTMTAYMTVYFQTMQTKLETISTLLINHVRDPDLHRGVDKSSIGLGRVRNLNTATRTEAVDGTSNSAYSTPKRVSDFTDANVYSIITNVFNDATDRLS